MCDDTCYLLPFDHLPSAIIVTSLLNHSLISDFIKSIYFEDAKRPITKAILGRINFFALLEIIAFHDIQEQIRATCEKYSIRIAIPEQQSDIAKIIFPDRLL